MDRRKLLWPMVIQFFQCANQFPLHKRKSNTKSLQSYHKINMESICNVVFALGLMSNTCLGST